MKKWFAALAITLALVLGTSNAAFAASGDLDTAFGVSGKVTRSLPDHNDAWYQATLSALQSDGKIINGADHIIQRDNADGSLDTTFGSSGYYEFTVPANHYWIVKDVGVDSSDNVMVAFTDILAPIGQPVQSKVRVARLTSSGSLDTSYGTSGYATFQTSGAEDVAHDMLVLSNDKVVVLGSDKPQGGTCSTNDAYCSYGFVGRFTSSGNLDSTFGTSGITELHDSGVGHDLEFLAGAVDSNNKVVAVGDVFESCSPCHMTPLRARFTTAGALDTTFASTGWTFSDVYSGDATGIMSNDVITDGNKLVVTNVCLFFGTGFCPASGSYNDDYLLVTKFNADGTVDTGFGSSGVVATQSTAEATAIGMAGTKYVIGGDLQSSGVEWVLVRLTSAGAIDTAWGTSGVVTTRFQSGDQVEIPYNILATTYGGSARVLVTGVQVHDYETTLASVAAARYLP